MLSIGDFLFSEKNDRFQDYVDQIKRLQSLKTEKEAFWVELLRQYVIGKKLVVVVADPSEEEMTKTGAEEKARVKKQAADLGELGLKHKKEDLEKAIAINEVRYLLLC